MKSSMALMASALSAQAALAFVQPHSSSSLPRPARATATSLRAERPGDDATSAAAAAVLAGLTLLAAPAAFASDDFGPPFRSSPLGASASAVGSSTLSVAEIDQFALPSYDASKGSTLIDLSSEVNNVNQKTLAKAKARREYVDTSAEKREADALRKAEKDGGSLLDGMLGNAEADRKAAIEAEKAESRANRWKTF